MEKIPKRFRENYTDLLNFSPEKIDLLVKWIDSLNLSNRAPSGMKTQFENLLFLKRQIDLFKMFKKLDPSLSSNIKVTLEHLTPEDMQILTTKLSKDNFVTEIKVGNIIFHNQSTMSQDRFQKISKDLISFLSTLKGFHAKALKGTLNIFFVKKEMSPSAAKYKIEQDAIYIRPDKVIAGKEYGSFSYVLVHELGHRYLNFNNVSFNHNSHEWNTTKYSQTVNTMTDEERFAELFALSHFNYQTQPFASYKETISKFIHLMTI